MNELIFWWSLTFALGLLWIGCLWWENKEKK